MQEKGTISVHSENIFPIIKKFLYSDHEVFLRELVANAVDATQKLKQLASIGEYAGSIDRPRIKITINENLKTLTISDQGLGMTAEEIKQYINQVAFSGARDFVEKYKDKGQQQQLIGFFGLGFYSAFMVADKVEITTKSYQKEAEPVHWSCDGSTTFELNKAVKTEVGTDVVLHINQESEEFLAKERIKTILNKYCKFLPVEIEFDGKVINQTQPLWTKTPSNLKDEDYITFYKELYPFASEPLFWIHLNVDYPFNLTGVLYFPQVANNLEQNPPKIQLYAKQVFITDEVKDMVPGFLMLLHGVIDSPDIPLNVSRSYLQTDSNVRKINSYITKKVADKLEELFKKDRKTYEEKWSGIEVFVKYGMLTEDKFYERAKDFVLLKNTAQEHFTLAEYQAKIKPQQTDKQQNLVMLYTNDPSKQDLYIQACQDRGYDVLVLNSPIDSHFISFLEQKLDKVQLKGVDADNLDQLIDPDNKPASVLNEEEHKRIQAICEEAITDKHVTWSVSPMSIETLPVTITVPELIKRIHHMAQLRTPGGEQTSLHLKATINSNHPLIQKMIHTANKDIQLTLARQVYHLALLSQDMLKGPALSNFIRNTMEDMKKE
jgi:molecular chaperone HtpG